jgi:signal transduction histidine kinase
MKSAFLAQMSHELRTPLNAIIGFSELISGEVLGPVGTAQYKEYALDIHTSGKHLLDIVTDILDLSKLEAGKYELQERELDVRSITDAALTMVGHPDRVSQAIHVALDPELPRLRADERAVKQILINLLSNAIKFSDKDSAVHVTASCPVGGPFRITVRDTGIGMRPEDIPIALAPFRQIDSRVARAYEGTGLGLSIVAALMKIHQGSLDIESEPGKGTSVTIEFPADRVVRRAANGADDSTAEVQRTADSTLQRVVDERRARGFAASPSR